MTELVPEHDELLYADGSVLLASLGTRDWTTKSGNPWHDPHTGKFADAPPGVNVLRGMSVLHTLVNSSKQLIEARRQLLSVSPNAMTADTTPEGNVRIHFFNGSHIVDVFDVPSTEAPGAPGPARTHAHPFGRATAGEYTGLPDLLQRASTPPDIVRHYDELRHQAALLQQRLSAPGMNPGDVRDAQATLNDVKERLKAIREEQRRVAEHLDSAPSDQHALMQRVRVPDHVQLGASTSATVKNLAQLPEASVGAKHDEALGMLVHDVVNGYGTHAVYNGKTEMRMLPHPGQVGDASWDGSVTLSPWVAKGAAHMDNHVQEGQITPNEFNKLSTVFHEATHQAVTPEAHLHLERLYAQSDPLAIFIEEGLAEHNSRVHLTRALETRGVSVHGGLPEQFHYMEEHAWVMRVRQSLEDGYINTYGLSPHEAHDAAMHFLATVHTDVGHPHDRMKLLDSEFRKIGEDFSRHANDLPGIGPHNRNEWSAPEPRQEKGKLAPEKLDFMERGKFSPKRFPSPEHAHLWAMDHWANEWLPHLEQGQQDAFKFYTTDVGYKHINGYLRGKPGEGQLSMLSNSEDRKYVEDAVTKMDAALNESYVPEDVHTWRLAEMGNNLDPSQPSELVGSVIRDNGYISTTLNRDIAESFGSYNNTDAVFRIDVPKGARAGYIEPLTVNTGENELLLPRGTAIEVTGYEGRDYMERPVFHARIVQQPASVDEIASLLTEQKDAQIGGKMAVEWPQKFSQNWMNNNVGSLTDQEYAKLKYILSDKGWTPDEIQTRVRPLRLAAIAKELDANGVKSQMVVYGHGTMPSVDEMIAKDDGKVYRVTEVTTYSAKIEGLDGKKSFLYYQSGWSSGESVLRLDNADIKKLQEAGLAPKTYTPGQPTNAGDKGLRGKWVTWEANGVLGKPSQVTGGIGGDAGNHIEVKSSLGGFHYLAPDKQVFVQQGPHDVIHNGSLGLDLKYDSPAGGTTGAKWYVDSNGQKWLVKTGNPDQLASEALANRIYRELGAPVGDLVITQVDGKDVIAIKEIPNGGIVGVGDHAQANAAFKKHFVADALVANWDTAGTGWDNMLIGHDGQYYRVDQGGTFFFRAQGGEKDFKGEFPTEMTSLMSSDVNPYSAKVFAGLTDAEKVQQIDHIEQSFPSPAKINAMVDSAGFSDSQMATKVKAAFTERLAALKKWAKETKVKIEEAELDKHSTSAPRGPTKLAKDVPVGTPVKWNGKDYNVDVAYDPQTGDVGLHDPVTGASTWVDGYSHLGVEKSTPKDEVKLTDSTTPPTHEPSIVTAGSLQQGDKFKALDPEGAAYGPEYTVNNVWPTQIEATSEAGATKYYPLGEPVSKTGVVTPEAHGAVMPANLVQLHGDYQVGELPPGTVIHQTKNNTFWMLTDTKYANGDIAAKQVVENDAGQWIHPPVAPQTSFNPNSTYTVWGLPGEANKLTGLDVVKKDFNELVKGDVMVNPHADNGPFFLVTDVNNDAVQFSDEYGHETIVQGYEAKAYPYNVANNVSWTHDAQGNINFSTDEVAQALQGDFAPGTIVKGQDLVPGMKVQAAGNAEHGTLTVSDKVTEAGKEQPGWNHLVDENGKTVINAVPGLDYLVVEPPPSGSGDTVEASSLQVGDMIKPATYGSIIGDGGADSVYQVVAKDASGLTIKLVGTNDEFHLAPVSTVAKYEPPTPANLPTAEDLALVGKTVKGSQIKPGMVITDLGHKEVGKLTVLPTTTKGEYDIVDANGKQITFQGQLKTVVPQFHYKVEEVGLVPFASQYGKQETPKAPEVPYKAGDVVKGDKLVPGTVVMSTHGNNHYTVTEGPGGHHTLVPLTAGSEKSVVPEYDYQVITMPTAETTTKGLAQKQADLKALSEMAIGNQVLYNGKVYEVVGVHGDTGVQLKAEDGTIVTIHHAAQVSHVSDGISGQAPPANAGAKVEDVLPGSYTLPPKVIKSWVQANVPQMTEKQYKNFVNHLLYNKSWTHEEISTKIEPYKATGGIIKATSTATPQSIIDPATGAQQFTSHYAGEQWAKSQLDGLKNRVPATLWQKVKSALGGYFDGTYSTINGYLRKGKFGSGSDPHTEGLIKAIDVGFANAKPISSDVVLWRRTSWPVPINQGDALIGHYVRDKGYMSTSYLSSSWSGHLAKLIMPAGTKLIHANDSHMSPHPGEREVLVPRGSIYKIVQIATMPGKPKMLVLRWVGTEDTFQVPHGKTLYGTDYKHAVIKLAQRHVEVQKLDASDITFDGVKVVFNGVELTNHVFDFKLGLGNTDPE